LSLSRVLRLSVAVGLTAYIVWSADPRAVADAMRGADLVWIASAVLLVFVDRALNAWRWIDLLAALSPGSRPPFPTVLRIFFVSTFVGSFLPSVGGDVYRAYSLSRYDVRLSESAASVLMDRVLGVLSMVLLSAAALAMAPQVPLDSWAGVSWAAASAGCLVAAAIVFSSHAAAAVHRAASRLPWPRLHRIALTLTEAVRRYANHHGELLRVLGASVMVQALRVLQAFCLGRAIGIDVPLGTFFVFIPIAVLMMQLPITVSGLGVAQGAFVWLFGQAGVAAAHATALSLLFIALGFLGNLPGATLYVMGERPTR
jgi:uncharacterized protein (TIRG00374 family)